MSLGMGIFLLGLFGVPVGLLSVAHRFRRRSARVQRIFWGATAGHLLAALVALVAGMIPPEAWAAGDLARGAAGLWALLLLPASGAAAAGLISVPAEHTEEQIRRDTVVSSTP